MVGVRNRQIFFAVIATFCLMTQTADGAVELPTNADPARQGLLAAPAMPSKVEDGERPSLLTFKPAYIPTEDKGFVLKDISISGNTALSTTKLQDILSGYKGQRIDAAWAEYLASQVMAHYYEAGYFLSKCFVVKINPQQGSLNLHVLEGYVGEVILDDPSGLAAQDIWGLVPQAVERISQLKPLHGPSLERLMLVLNQPNQIQVSATLYALPPDKAAQLAPGAVGVILSLRPITILRGEVAFNNYGSEYLGPEQALLSAQLQSPLSVFDQMKFSFSGSLPLHEMKYGTLTYSSLLSIDGLRLALTAGHTQSNPGDSLKDFEIKGATYFGRVDLSYPLILERVQNLSVSTAIEVRNSHTDSLGDKLFDDRLRVASLSLTYDLSDSWQGRSIIEARISQGLGLLNSSASGVSDLSRAEGQSRFTKITASFARLQVLPYGLSGLMRLQGQYSSAPLLSSEEFGFGGIGLGRAYDNSELLGDNGLSVGFELRYEDIPEMRGISFRPFAFFDIGKVWNRDSGSTPMSGASAGGGVYLHMYDRFSGSLTVAQPLTRQIDNPPSDNPQGPRFLFEASASF